MFSVWVWSDYCSIMRGVFDPTVILKWCFKTNMIQREKNSFQELFKDKKYISVKNYLYNYLLRKRAIKKCLKDDHPDLMLEVGSGISPLVTDRSNIVYSDISFEAISILKRTLARGYYVVAEGGSKSYAKAN